MRALLAAAMGLATFSPLALVLVPVPKASSQVRRELRLTPRSEAIALSVAPGVALELLGVGLAWHGGKVPHFPSDMLVSACPPPGGQVRFTIRAVPLTSDGVGADAGALVRRRVECVGGHARLLCRIP